MVDKPEGLEEKPTPPEFKTELVTAMNKIKEVVFLICFIMYRVRGVNHYLGIFGNP